MEPAEISTGGGEHGPVIIYNRFFEKYFMYIIHSTQTLVQIAGGGGHGPPRVPLCLYIKRNLITNKVSTKSTKKNISRRYILGYIPNINLNDLGQSIFIIRQRFPKSENARWRHGSRSVRIP